MTKKNEKKLCWNCEGNVSHHLSQCPYCGVDVTKAPSNQGENFFKGFESPFTSSAQPKAGARYASQLPQEAVVTEQEWNDAINEDKEPVKEEGSFPLSNKRQMVAFLLLLPGIAFLLFGLALILFSRDGVLTLQWNQNVAYFYFIGASPLLYIGWRALKGNI